MYRDGWGGLCSVVESKRQLMIKMDNDDGNVLLNICSYEVEDKDALLLLMIFNYVQIYRFKSVGGIPNSFGIFTELRI